MVLQIDQNKNQANLPAVKKADISCPSCNNTSCDRIPRGKIVKVLFFWLAIKRYKCYSCWRKFYVFNSNKKRLTNLISE
jgi:transposase-like protein